MPFDLSLLSLGQAALALLQGDGASYAVSGSADLATPWGPLALPFAHAGEAPIR